MQPLEPVEIMVRSGDTLSEIAAAHGHTTSELMAMNGIADASKIRIDQVLTVSMTSTPSEQSASLPGGGYGAAWNIGGRLLVAANAGGVAVSGLEQTQNSMRLSWSRAEVDNRLREIMRNIHGQCIRWGEDGDGVDYVKGANIAGFLKVANAMLDQGVV